MSIQPLPPTYSAFEKIEQDLTLLNRKQDLKNVSAFFKAFSEIYKEFKQYERPPVSKKSVVLIYNACVKKINDMKEALKMSAQIQHIELSISKGVREPIEISVSKEVKSDSGTNRSRSASLPNWVTPVPDDADAPVPERNSESGDADDENEPPALQALKEPSVVHERNESGFINALHAHKPSESAVPALQPNPSEPSVLPKDLHREPTRTADLKPIDIPKGCCAIL